MFIKFILWKSHYQLYFNGHNFAVDLAHVWCSCVGVNLHVSRAGLAGLLCVVCIQQNPFYPSCARGWIFSIYFLDTSALHCWSLSVLSLAMEVLNFSACDWRLKSLDSARTVQSQPCGLDVSTVCCIFPSVRPLVACVAITSCGLLFCCHRVETIVSGIFVAHVFVLSTADLLLSVCHKSVCSCWRVFMPAHIVTFTAVELDSQMSWFASCF